MTARQSRGPALADLLPDWRAHAQASRLPAGWAGEALAALEIKGLQLDSRKITPGDLFIALPGFDRHRSSDGRRYLDQAVAAGAVAVFVEAEGWAALAKASYPVPVIPVPQLSRRVSGIAATFYARPSERLNVIGITGTNGKTTCSHLLAQLFNRLDVRTAVLGTLGYGVPGSPSGLVDTGLTTPDAIATQAILAELLDAGVSTVAMEISSHGLDQGRIESVRLRGGVFTNLSRDHLDYHGSMSAYRAAKARLFQTPNLEFAVINLDDAAGREILAGLRQGIRCYGYSLGNPQAALWLRTIRHTEEGVEAELTSPWGEGLLRSGLIADFNLSNLLAVIAAACASGLPFEQVISAASTLRPVAGRLEVINSDKGPRVVVDYAHTPDALEKVLGALRSASRRESQPGQLWCVFGCGGDRDPGKRAEMGAVAARLADRVVITSDNPRGESPAAIMAAIAQGAGTAAVCIEERAEAIRHAITRAAEHDIVLIAGKGHENYQITGQRRLPFSDAAQARLALGSRRR